MAHTEVSKETLTFTLQQAEAHVLALYDQQRNPKLLFHSFHLCAKLTTRARELAIQESADPKTREIVLLAAWFLYTGYLYDHRHWLDSSLRELRRFFAAVPFAEEGRARIVQCLQTVSRRQLPASRRKNT